MCIYCLTAIIPLAPELLFLGLEDTYEDTLSTKKDHKNQYLKIEIILKKYHLNIPSNLTFHDSFYSYFIILVIIII